MYAAISTPGIPPSVNPSAARIEKASNLMNRRLATGMRNAQDPIIIGNAAMGFIPSRLTIIMHGAYNPMPIVISAPKQKLTAIPIHKRRALEAERIPGKSEVAALQIRQNK